MNSAIFAGGSMALFAALICACLIVLFLPSDLGPGRLRVAGFFVLWQAFTPIQAWWIDMPALVGSTFVLEMVYRRFAW